MSLGLTVVAVALGRGIRPRRQYTPPLFGARLLLDQPGCSEGNRTTMLSPAQTWARLIGWTLLLVGVVGFFYSSAFGSPGEVDALFGIFDVNGFDNLLHVLTG